MALARFLTLRLPPLCLNMLIANERLEIRNCDFYLDAVRVKTSACCAGVAVRTFTLLKCSEMHSSLCAVFCIPSLPLRCMWQQILTCRSLTHQRCIRIRHLAELPESLLSAVDRTEPSASARLCVACVCSPQLPAPPPPPAAAQWALAAVTVQLWDAIATSPPFGDYHAEPHLARHLHQYPWCKQSSPPPQKRELERREEKNS